MSEHLEPCPFCGAGETNIRETTHWTGLRSQVISARVIHWCVREEGRPSSGLDIAGKTREDAVRKWNQRIAAARNAAGVVEALRPLEQALAEYDKPSGGVDELYEIKDAARAALAAVKGVES